MKFFMNVSLLKRNRPFRFLFLGQSVSFFGTMITSVALPYQIYHETHSTLMVGLLSLAQLVPLIFTALLGGVFADRYHRRRLLIISETILSIGCLLLAFNSLYDVPKIWVMFLVAPLMSAVTGLHRPALDSLNQQIVEKKDFPAQGVLISFMANMMMILGPAIGGLIISHFGIFITFIIDFSTFMISLLAILQIHGIPKPVANHDESTWAALKSGGRYALSRQELLGTYIVDFVAMIFGMPNALFPAIAQSFGGVKTLGLLYSAPAVGAVIVSLIGSTWITYFKRHGVAISIAATIWGIAIIFFGLSNYLWLALFFLAIAGGADAVSGIFRQVMWNETIPNNLRGRLAGIEMISYLSGPRLGDTEAGLVAAAFGVTVSLVSGGVLCVLGVLACSFALPKFWRYHSEKHSESHV